MVWNEVATLVSPADEAAFLSRARSTAQELGIDLVLAYAVLESESPVLLDNKYVFIGDDGAILDEYQKHHPVPGEPSIRGSGALRLLDRPYGRVGGAICYDYDFPATGARARPRRRRSRFPASSDWRGIHPVHTLMARVRAIEGGFSLVRSTRWAASGMFDRLGTVRAWMPPGEDGVLVAEVPIARAETIPRPGSATHRSLPQPWSWSGCCSLAARRCTGQRSNVMRTSGNSVPNHPSPLDRE